MELTFTPSPNVAVLLHALLDQQENRIRRSGLSQPDGAPPVIRTIKIRLADLDLPGYFSQTDPEPRLVANHQFQEMALQNWLTLTWLPCETGHLLESVTLSIADPLYALLKRDPLANRQNRLETLLLADRFRFAKEDWRSKVLRYAIEQMRTGKSTSPFSLSDMEWNTDLLAVLVALTEVPMETPYRAFSVRSFNDSKRFERLKPAWYVWCG